MAIATSRTQLNQGLSNSVADAVFATGTGADINITSVGSNLPALAALEFFEIRNHPNTQNNGLYRVVTVTTSTSDYEVDKVTSGTPVVAASAAVVTRGATGAANEKSIHFDVSGLGYYILEQGNITADGANGQAIYSHAMQEWKDDNYLIGNSKFLMLAIDSDAGKYIFGQNAAGINTGWAPVDLPVFGIRTRKLMRNMGLDELDANGITVKRSVGVLTVDVVEDPVNDTPFYQFGNDTIVDDTVDFTFNGAINEMVEFYTEQAQPGSLAITPTTITRVGGSFITEGYKVGGQVSIRSAEDAGNDAVFTLTAVSATVLTTSGLTANTADTTAILAVDNKLLFKVGMRVRDGDVNGKTFAQATLTTIQKTTLSNFVYQFPMATGQDTNIAATDVTIDGSLPYTGMSLTLFASPQARAGLVGGSFNFGIIMDANNGTDKQVYEWLQRQLRKLTDIDADASTAIGRTLDLMASYRAGFLEVGSADGGLSFPTNPDGGGSGIYIDNLNATSSNAVKFWDNTGTLRANPETIAITVDANQTAIDDLVYEYDLFYDRTLRTSVTDFVLNSGTGKITSAGSNLPANAEIAVNKYIRIGGLTGADAAMNGFYQITLITTSGADWTVVRYDGVALVSVAAATVNADQNCVDSPDKIIVDTNTLLTSTGISFTANNTMADTGNGLGVFSIGDFVRVGGTTNNEGIREVATVAAGTITFVETNVTTEAAGASVTVTKIFSGLVNADISESYAFDSNTQGGRTVSTSAFVQARGVGLLSGQYAESTVQTIASGTPLIIPLTAQIERNVA